MIDMTDIHKKHLLEPSGKAFILAKRSDNVHVAPGSLCKIAQSCSWLKSSFVVLMGSSFFLLSPHAAYAQSNSAVKNNTKIELGEYTLKISFPNQENSPKGKTLIKFKSLIENKSQGRVKVQLYPFSRLLKEEDELEGLELGVADIIVPITSKVATGLGIKEYQVFDLPFLFAGQNNFAKFLDSELNASLLKKVNEKSKNYVALAFWGNGFRGVSSNKPIQNVQDFKNLTIGLQYSEPTIDTFLSLGSNVIKMAEYNLNTALNVKTALAANVRKIDATDNTMSSFNFYALHDNQRYFTNTNHAYSVYTVLINHQKLTSFPEDIQKMIITSAESVQTYHYEVAEEDNDKSAIEARAKGVVISEISEINASAMREKVISVHQDFARRNKEMMTKMYQIIK